MDKSSTHSKRREDSAPLEHTWVKHENCERPYCMFCEGGLSACEVCGGFEGTLTTDCCGRQLTEEEQRLIYNEGVLDFRHGEWVKEPNYPRSK